MAGEDGGGALELLLPALLGELPDVLDEVARALASGWPRYAEFLAQQPEGATATGHEALRRVTGTAIRELAVVAGEHAPSGDEGLEVFEEIGRAESEAGTGLTTLLSAYRAGARAGWRRMAETAVREGMPADAVARLAEAVFLLVDQLSVASARGYVQHEHHSAAEHEQARVELVELLLSGRADRRQVAAAAEQVHWRLPGSARVVLVDPSAPGALERLARLPGDCLPLPGGHGVVAPDLGDAARLLEHLGSVPASVGLAVPLDGLAESLRLAEAAARLQRSGVLPDRPLLVEDHLDAILVRGDDRLFACLAERVLAPLMSQPEPTRERLTTTLGSWLRHMGNLTEVSQELHIHRQTVRYRLGQLRALLDDDLDSPASRLRLTLVLGWPSPSDAGRAQPDPRGPLGHSEGPVRVVRTGPA